MHGHSKITTSIWTVLECKREREREREVISSCTHDFQSDDAKLELIYVFKINSILPKVLIKLVG